MAKTLVRFFSAVIILSILLAQFGLRPVRAAADFVVNSTADKGDANLEDQICKTSTPDECTLCAAVQQANALEGPDTISLEAKTYTLSLEAPGRMTRRAEIWTFAATLSLAGLAWERRSSKQIVSRQTTRTVPSMSWLVC
jgi:hypothetical protein